LRSLRRATHRAAGIALLKKAVFNFAIDTTEPLFGTIGSFSRSSELSLQLGNAVFSRSQLIRKLLRHAKRMTTVVVGYAGGLCDQLQDGLARFVELIVSARGGAVASSREWNDFRILSELTMHRSILHAHTVILPPKARLADDNPRVRSFLF
jgi:hypothetical protein